MKQIFSKATLVTVITCVSFILLTMLILIFLMFFPVKISSNVNNVNHNLIATGVTTELSEQSNIEDDN